MAVMGIFNKANKELKIVEESEFEKDNKEEHLQSIMEKNPELVSEESVTLRGTKALPSGKTPDLILCSRSGILTIVELKRGKASRDAIAQLLEYAAEMHKMQTADFFSYAEVGLEDLFRKLALENDEDRAGFETALEESLKKPRLLLVSYDIDDAAKRLADFLRSTCGVQIYCINFDYYSDDNQEIFVPKEIGEEYVEELEKREWSPTQKAYFDFFGEVLNEFKIKNPGRTDRKGTHGAWLQVTAGIRDLKNTHLEWEFRGKAKNKEFWTVLHFEHMKVGKEKNKKIFEIFKEFEKKTGTFKKYLGETPEIRFEGWRTVIGVKKDVGSLEGANNPEIKSWAVNQMTNLDRAWKAALQSLGYVNEKFELTTAGRIALL